MFWNVSEDVVRQRLIAPGPVSVPWVVAAMDLPTRVSFVLQRAMESWGMTWDGLISRARANLESMSPAMQEHLVPLEMDFDGDVLRLNYGDYFNASRIALAERLYRAACHVLDGDDEFLVAVPSRDLLLVTRHGSREDYQRFQGLVRWCHERQPGPISSLCFVLGPKGLTGYRATEGDTA